MLFRSHHLAEFRIYWESHEPRASMLGQMGQNSRIQIHAQRKNTFLRKLPIHLILGGSTSFKVIKGLNFIVFESLVSQLRFFEGSNWTRH